MESICPFMASGWLTNVYAAKTKEEDTFNIENLPRCIEENCSCWVLDDREGSVEKGFCGLINQKVNLID